MSEKAYYEGLVSLSETDRFDILYPYPLGESIVTAWYSLSEALKAKSEKFVTESVNVVFVKNVYCKAHGQIGY